MNPNLILSDHRFLHNTPGFTAGALLARINSPRLRDMSDLGSRIDCAADAAGISRELLCCIPQKEQSALTDSALSAWALRAFCGYGVTRRGQEPKHPGPQAQIVSASACLRYWFGRWKPGAWEACPDGDVIAANAATYALYRYTPSRADKANLLSIWDEFGFGDPLATQEAPPMTGFGSVHPSTAERLAAVGITDGQIVQGVGHAEASKGTHEAVGMFNGRQFGHCIDVRTSFAFSRAHFDALVEQGFAPFPREGWSDGDHWHIIDASGLPSYDGRPDHLPTVNRQLREWVRGGDGLVGDEPMPDRWRPTPGQAAFIAKVWITHEYFVLAGDLLVVGPTGAVIDCHPTEQGGITVAQLRPLVEALGFEVHYRIQPQGPRIYLKLAPPSSP